MRHLRTDYEAIQPWPTKRPHIARWTTDHGESVVIDTGSPELPTDPTEDELEPIIPDDEPVFLLRAKDRFAPELVRGWANALIRETVKSPTMLGEVEAGRRAEARSLADRVLAWADEMEAYAAEHYDGGKVPDTPSERLRP